MSNFSIGVYSVSDRYSVVGLGPAVASRYFYIVLVIYLCFVDVTIVTKTDDTYLLFLLNTAIKSEMALFDSSGKRGAFLQAVYSYLLTVPPTSVEAERAFSAAGLFVTKLRSRLGDQSIDTLCFLRAFYGRKMQD